MPTSVIENLQLDRSSNGDELTKTVDGSMARPRPSRDDGLCDRFVPEAAVEPVRRLVTSRPRAVVKQSVFGLGGDLRRQHGP